MKLNSCLAAILASGVLLPFALSAETVARALVKIAGSGNSKLFVYNISDTGEWTRNKVFCDQRSSYAIRRAQCVNGIVYVMEAASGASGAGGYIYRYRADGTFIDQYLSFDGSADGMVVTPDAHYLFVANNEDNTYKGRLMRYDMVKNEWKVDYGFSSSAFMRQMCTDDSGHLYVANRNSPHVYKFDIEHDGEKYTDSNYEARSESLDLVGAVCWDPATDRIYSGGRTTIRSCDSDLKTLAQATVPTAFEWFYASAVINGKVYFGSYQTYALYLVDPDDCSTTKVTVDGATDKYKYDHIVDFPATEKNRWSFDDAAGAAVGAEKVYLQGGARLGATGVRGNSLCLGGETARAELSGSQTLFGRTNDFAVSFNALLPAKEDATDARVLFSNDAGQGGALSVLVRTDNTLGLSYRATSGGTPVELTTEAVVADGAWHHIGLVRTAETSLKLLMDGAVVGTATLNAGDPISRAWTWHLGSKAGEDGGFAGVGAFFDELVIFDSKSMPYPATWAKLAKERTGAPVPVVPDAPTRKAQPLASGLGTEIAHAFADDAPIGAPCVFKASDGAWYLASGRGNARSEANQVTRIWKSVNGGETWTDFDTIAAASVSLFEFPENGGSLHAVGMDGYYAFKLWKYDATRTDGTHWELLSTLTKTDAFEIAPGRVEPEFSRIGRPAVFRTDVLNGRSAIGYVYFDVWDGAITPGKADGKTDAAFESPTYSSLTTIESIAPAECAFGPEDGPSAEYDQVSFLVPVKRVRPEGTDYVVGREDCFLAGMYEWPGVDAGCYLKRRTNGVTLPGSSAAFAVRWDATSGKYWAITMPGEGRNRMELFVSPDLIGWYPCGVVAESTSAAFVTPSFEIDGDDLLVAYGVVCDDGAGGPRSAGDANYLAVRRITGFRTVFTPEKPDWNRLFVTDGSDEGSVRSYWLSQRGEWLSEKVLARTGETICGEKFLQPIVASLVGRNLYVACAQKNQKVKIFQFNRRGNCRRVFVAPDGVTGSWVAMAVSPDGRSIYVVSESSENVVRKIDVATGTWSVFLEGKSELIKIFHLATGADGSVYTSNYGGDSSVYRWTASGELVKKVAALDVNATGMAVDDVNGVIYCADVRGRIYRVNLESGEKQMICSRYNGSVTPSFELALFGGKLHVTSAYGWVYAIDTETLEEAAAVGTIYRGNGVAAGNLDIDGGMMILVR